jgi:polyphosphate kinase 2
LAEKLEKFDLDDPRLPKAIDEGALASGGYPYDKKMHRGDYEREMQAVQEQLARLQAHVRQSGMRIVIVFEGRDAAGKGGTIKRYLEYLNPRFNVHVALDKPTDRERTQWYFQRYVAWLPAAGEQALFDRSWYNRAGVEPVMGFCTEEQTRKFLQEVPQFERMLLDDGIMLFKVWLTIGREMQLKRFHARRHDPLKIWKLSPVDLKALAHFDDYTAARNRMFEASHSERAPWQVVFDNDKRRGRINTIRLVLHGLDYEGKDKGEIGPIDDKIVRPANEFLKSHASS